ncbi:hypothetical protein THOM_1009 [Trachipleistophora hominis]|uniref:Uncharacterized protein n=1 Tax=Trachipleistophora hominis TaxID=72359 RepID=L7JY74_TRAHO|nr:hypothetical protein THOM_1009 [Trachipleistophora hominis]
MLNLRTIERNRKLVKEFVRETENKLKIRKSAKPDDNKEAPTTTTINRLHAYYANRIGFVDSSIARECAAENIKRKEISEKVENIGMSCSGVLYNLHNNTCFDLKEYFGVYLTFTRIIDLGEYHFSIKEFDLNVFLVILSHDHIDRQIVRFLCKMADDPADYSKEEKKKFYYVLFLGYFYVSKIKNAEYTNDIKRIKDKLYLKTKKMSYLLDTKIVSRYHCDIKPVHDHFLDKIIVKLFVNRIKSEKTASSDSKFFNSCYTMYLRRDKIDFEIFYYFQKNLNITIKTLPHEQHVHFLKNVFLRDTVLYSLTDVRQIIKFIFLFYTNKLAPKIQKKILYVVLDFFHVLSMNYRLIDALLDEMSAFLDNEAVSSVQDDRMKMVINQHAVRSSRCFDDFSTFLIFNSDSFHSTKLLVDHFLNIYKYFDVNYARFMAIIEFLGLLVSKIKMEFLYQIYMALVECLQDIINEFNTFLNSRINGTDSTDLNGIILSLTVNDTEKLKKFVDKFVKTYFKLFTGRTGEEKKKKRKGCARENVKDKKMLNLMGVLRDNEGIVNSYLERCQIDRKYSVLKDKGLSF